MAKDIQQQLDKEAILRAEVARLQKVFRESLPERFSAIQCAWDQCLESQATPVAKLPCFSELHRLVHTLTGSAGTFSMPTLSRNARTVEVYLKSILNSGAVVAEEQSEKIDTFLQLLQDSVDPDEPESADIVEAESLETLTSHVPAKPKILLVEDDSVQSEFLCIQMTSFGFDVIPATGIEQAEKLLKQESPDVIVCDIQFPEGDMAGIEFIRLVNAFLGAHKPSPPVIFISARTDIEARLSVVRTAPGASYFNKPLNLSALMDKVLELTSTNYETAYNVLVIDDDESLCEWISVVLDKAAMKVTTCVNPKLTLEKLSENRPDLILMDYHLPGCNGAELAQVIRQHQNYMGIPILFLSADNDEAVQLNALVQGGDEFVNKPLKAETLTKLVLSKVKRSRDLNKQMMCDGLTGLFNHTYSENLLERELERLNRQVDTELSFVMIDIDHFKTVNDTYGHVTGDSVIRTLSHMLKNRLRSTDIIGRYGGEEFVVIMPDTSIFEAISVVTGIREAFNQITHYANGESFNVTFSAGIASTKQEIEATQLTHSADEALYQAKQQGRDKICIAQ